MTLKENSFKITRKAPDTKDLTIHKLERELIKIQPVQAIGELAMDIGHDMRGCLTIIQFFIEETLRKNPFLRTDIAEETEKALDHIKCLVNSMMNLNNSSTKKGNDDLLELSSLIDGILLLHKNYLKRVHPKIQLETQLEKNLNVQVNRFEISQIIINLFKNALDSLSQEKNQKIKITLEKIRFLRKNKLVPGAKFSISDNGCGINENINIFERGETDKHTGNGIGLDIVRKNAKKNNLLINVMSKNGFGTTIEIYFPTS